MNYRRIVGSIIHLPIKSSLIDHSVIYEWVSEAEQRRAGSAAHSPTEGSQRSVWMRLHSDRVARRRRVRSDREGGWPPLSLSRSRLLLLLWVADLEQLQRIHQL